MNKKNESSLEALYWLEQVADDDADLVLGGKDSDSITAVVSKELKERLKKYAEINRWSMSQAAGVLIEEGLKRFDAESEGKEAK